MECLQRVAISTDSGIWTRGISVGAGHEQASVNVVGRILCCFRNRETCLTSEQCAFYQIFGTTLCVVFSLILSKLVFVYSIAVNEYLLQGKPQPVYYRYTLSF